MRIGVIRGDLPGPLFLADMETVSQYNPPIEPSGQERNLSRPTVTTVGNMLSAYIPASFASTGNITFPLVINAGNQTLRIRSAVTDPYSVVLVPTGNYANITALVNAIKTVLPAAFTATNVTSLILSLQTTAKGEGKRIQIDTVGNGSTFNTPAVLGAGGGNFTVPSPATFIAAGNPVGGPINVSSTLVRTQLGSGLTDTQVEYAAASLAPKFYETEPAIKSFQVGNVSKLRSSSFNPDPSRIPAISNGAAIAVVADDGVTAFTAPLPNITNAQFNVPSPGAVTITGVGLAGPGTPNSEVVATTIKFLTSPEPRKVPQAIVTSVVGGIVSSTSIVIPASKVPTGVGVGTKVQVFYTSLASNQFTIV